MSVPEQRDPFAYYAQRLVESTAALVATRVELAALRDDFRVLLASHEHSVASQRIDGARMRRLLIALLGDQLTDAHRADVKALLATTPVG